MKLLALAILSINVSNSFGLSCLAISDRESIQISLATKTFDQIIEMIENLGSVEYHDQDRCCVGLNIHYDRELLLIKFVEHLNDSSLKDQDVQIVIAVGGHEKEDLFIRKFLQYKCSTKGCEVEFIKKYLKWFIDDNRPDLPNELAPLLLGDDEESGRCFNAGGMLKECSSGPCAIDVERPHNEKPVTSQFCTNSQSLIPGSLYFMIGFNLKLGHMYRQYGVHCKYDGCNNYNTLNRAIETFHQEYELDAILKVFDYQVEGREADEETTRTFTRSSSSRRQTNSAQSSAATSLATSTATTSTRKGNYNQTDTTTQTNAGSCAQSTKGMIYVAWIIFIHHLLFRG